jgi:hypothetical protein
MKKVIKYVFPIALIIVSSVFMVLGVGTFGFWDSSKGPLGGFYPTLIAGLLFCVSVANLLHTRTEKEPVFPRQDWFVVLAVLAVFLCTYIVGMLPSIIAFLFFWLFKIEKYTWKKSVVFACCVTLVIYLVFGLWLGIAFPPGLAGRLILG